jgi:hypothetical protein
MSKALGVQLKGLGSQLNLTSSMPRRSLNRTQLVKLPSWMAVSLELASRGYVRNGVLAEAHLDVHALKSVLGVKR